jgi:hypothetical protein
LFAIQERRTESDVDKIVMTQIHMLKGDTEWKEQCTIAAIISPSKSTCIACLRRSEHYESLFTRIFHKSASVKRVSPAVRAPVTAHSFPLTQPKRSVYTLLENAHNHTTATLGVKVCV